MGYNALPKDTLKYGRAEGGTESVIFQSGVNHFSFSQCPHFYILSQYLSMFDALSEHTDDQASLF